MKQGNLGANLMSLLFPQSCIFCGTLCPPGPMAWCGCALPFAPASQCPLCHHNVANCRCTFHFRQVIAPLYYENPVRPVLLKFKKNATKSMVKTLVLLMESSYDKSYSTISFQAVVPVPMNAATLRERKYNQAERLATELGKQLSLPVEKHLLLRSEDSVPQHTLPFHERHSNAQQSYKLAPKVCLSGGNYLLVDDICTTGATLEACSVALKKGGAQGVYAMGIASVPPHKGNTLTTTLQE